MLFILFSLCCVNAVGALSDSWPGVPKADSGQSPPQTRLQGINLHTPVVPHQEYSHGRLPSTGRATDPESAAFAQYSEDANQPIFTFSPQTLAVLNQPYPEQESEQFVATLLARASTSKKPRDKVEQGLAALFPKGSVLLIRDMQTGTVDRYIAGDVRNRGSFGVVMEVTQAQSKTAYAMKVMYREASREELLSVEPLLRNFLDMEFESMGLLKKHGASRADLVSKYRLAIPLTTGEVVGVPLVSRSPQMVAYYGRVVLMPLLIADLANLHVSPRDTRLQHHLLREIVRATAALHSLGLSHGDIKEHNMMFDRDGKIMLIDFGNLHAFGSQVPCAEQIISPDYVSPELARACLLPSSPFIVSDKHDSWSVGVMLFLLACGRRRELPFSLSQAFQKATSHTHLFRILAQIQDELWTTKNCQPAADPVVMEVARALLQVNPQNRATVSNLVAEFPFFQTRGPSPSTLQKAPAVATAPLTHREHVGTRPQEPGRAAPFAPPLKVTGHGRPWAPRPVYPPIPALGPRGHGVPRTYQQPQQPPAFVPRGVGHGLGRFPQEIFHRPAIPGVRGQNEAWTRQRPQERPREVPRLTGRVLGWTRQQAPAFEGQVDLASVPVRSAPTPAADLIGRRRALRLKTPSP